MSEARKITDHEEIRDWAEQRGGVPSVVKDTERHGSGAGILRFDFDGQEESLKKVDWDTFFKTFEEKKLALLAQDEVDGGTSRFFKFIER
jgi:hypothetical protein